MNEGKVVGRLSIFIFIAACLCFAKSLLGEFVWDDWALIVATNGLRGFDARHLRWMFTTFHMANYTPLSWLSYGLDYSIWGLRPAGYHLTNLLLHAGCAVLFYRLAANLMRLIFPREDPFAVEVGAAFAALSFALHPLRVESVAWASERRDVLAGFFFMASLIFYVKAAQGTRRRLLLPASLACFIPAALAKPSVVPLPAALLILDYFPLRRLSPALPARKLSALLLEKLPYGLISAACALLVIHAQTVTRNFTTLARHDLPSRLAQSLYGLGFYISKTLAPAELSPLYPLPDHLGLLDGRVLRSSATVAAAIGGFIMFRAERRAAIALWCYYFVFLLPVLGLLQNGDQLVALRYSYLSCLGWALLAGCVMAKAWGAWSKSGFSAAAATLPAALCLWLAANAWLTQGQLRIWHDDRALWGSVLSRYPSCAQAHAGLADALARKGEFEQAARHGQVALSLSANNPGKIHEIVGSSLLMLNRLDEALPHYRQAAILEPESAAAQANLGSLLARQGKFSEALQLFEMALRLDPNNSDYSRMARQAKRDMGQ